MKWTIANRQIPSDTHGLPPSIAALAAERAERAGQSLRDWLDAKCPDLGTLHELDESVQHVRDAVKNDELIGVFHDFDVDGVSSGTIMTEALEAYGANVRCVPAQRSDGYGFRPIAAERLIAKGAKTIITLDCGTSDHEAIELCAKAGVKVITVDHHETKPGPWPGFRMVNPKKPDCNSELKHMCTAGLSYLFARELLGKDVDSLLEVAAIGTVSDMAPLWGVNRWIVRRGAAALANTERAGLRTLMRLCGVKGDPTSTDISWKIGPALNSPGRIGNASTSLMVLRAKNLDEAESYARECFRLNAERKEYTDAALAEARAMVDESATVIVVSKKGWHEGIVGLIAGRLMHEYGRPVFAVGVRDGEAKGSCRAPNGVDVVKLLSACSEHLVRFGGHKAAGGFSLLHEKLGDFTEALFKTTADIELNERTLSIDCQIDPSVINPSWLQCLEQLEPFGVGNKAPLFGWRGLLLQSAESLGKESSHTQLYATSLSDSLERQCRLVYWRHAPSDVALLPGRPFDVAYKAEITRWRGRPEAQLTVEALRDEYGRVF